ncbi:MAG: hypothetical protein A2700_00845 [Candidatus Blackburnbacteria bacterium RIFCSPHIGHO2_01_FULL_44_64]|uniref:Uncharacterized protein n=1 Tax=Candidatus Blackburnbacteria bacterium RIFCSPHIGHO2_02_FULL_44_20 TaxID=1797516 RepID=A0A1G1V8Q7_9BACT|nr:MAG: hypothetical protein A2700_00845 [Candidatus Blackburnbacteria bacterium RIFCSPHIGHO2_01_FULL_44_64]OGY10420.1 MAG: hypothetical protein A3E16_00830 [Candidatus Blackburnbacteria bacterium RIFCSPHIGHO2_12_FULL_44_25]OGY11743.1 MAG: hypothetical protein A3D26_02125 [Candidatus Blackburnbacteria bacterium RIFCSPHIGHO2_02_FULL_44_20]OGY14979.1 MAG: hypothetical protein A3A62_02345 [Candidatus Blackburnbacteria bacterium RIFCSPLOWO2_01_FULL_44_43]OGY15494.1 MAG: hypothetical protein A3H88_0
MLEKRRLALPTFWFITLIVVLLVVAERSGLSILSTFVFVAVVLLVVGGLRLLWGVLTGEIGV